MNLIGAADLQPIVTIKEPSKSEWIHLSIAGGGSRVLSVGGFPSFQLDVWDIVTQTAHAIGPDDTRNAGVSQQRQKQQQQQMEQSLASSPQAVNIARIPLGNRLTSLGCASFPLNSDVICACGEKAVRVINLEPLPGGHNAIRQVCAFC